MKKLICVLFALMMLCGMAGTEELTESAACNHTFMLEDTIRENHLRLVEDTSVSPALFVSARCTKCEEQGIVFDDMNLLEADPCEPEECIHRMYRIPGQNGQYWRTQSSEMPELVMHDVGMCIDCGIVATLVKVIEWTTIEQQIVDAGEACEHEYLIYDQAKPYSAGYESCGDVHHAYYNYYLGTCRYCNMREKVVVVDSLEPHTMVYTGKNQHNSETNRHEIHYECSVCYEKCVETIPCAGPESRVCDIVVPQVK